MAVQADIANVEALRVREAVKKIRPSKKDLRHLGKGDDWEGILDEMKKLDKKDRERAPTRQLV